jgi:putative transposase
MKADDVKRTVDSAIKTAKLVTKQKTRLLSDEVRALFQAN